MTAMMLVQELPTAQCAWRDSSLEVWHGQSVPPILPDVHDQGQGYAVLMNATCITVQGMCYFKGW